MIIIEHWISCLDDIELVFLDVSGAEHCGPASFFLGLDLIKKLLKQLIQGRSFLSGRIRVHPINRIIYRGLVIL